MSEASAAQNARRCLNGYYIYSSCCTLRIDYSKLATLNIKYNNDKSRDYTNPSLPSGEINFEHQLNNIGLGLLDLLSLLIKLILKKSFF